jgi:hypothetical protein
MTAKEAARVLRPRLKLVQRLPQPFVVAKRGLKRTSNLKGLRVKGLRSKGKGQCTDAGAAGAQRLLLEQLPVEVLVEVMLQLDLPSVLSIAQVCRRASLHCNSW